MEQFDQTLCKSGRFTSWNKVLSFFSCNKQIPLDPQRLSLEVDPFFKWGCLSLEFINIQPPKLGSDSKIHQHTAPQKGVRLQNSSTYSPPKGVCLQNSSTKGGPLLDFINQKGIPSTKKGAPLQGQFLRIQRQVFMKIFKDGCQTLGYCLSYPSNFLVVLFSHSCLKADKS